MRVLVCGGRDFKDGSFLSEELYKLNLGIDDVIIEGGARGADYLAHVWAAMNSIKIEQYPADWDRHGKAAGYIRNQQMLDEGHPDLVLAFKGGKGTDMMVRLAIKEGVPVVDLR